MKTVKYLAEKGCKVKVNGKYYSGDDVIPTDKISEDELKNLIAARFIRKITLKEDDGGGNGAGNGDGTGTGGNAGNGDGAGNGGGNSGEKSVDEMSKKELKAKAKELGLDVGMLDNEDEIRRKIKEAQGAA